jgi:SAM-dependent methyltransferase
MMTQPDKAQVKDFYDKQYYSDIVGAGSPTSHHFRLARRIGIEKGDKVLDVACGTGEWVKAAVTCGATATGIDLSEKAIEFCRSDNPAADFYCQGADSLPFDTGNFDLVSCLGSLEHFPDKAAALEEMTRVLKSGGRLLISVPNSAFIGYRTGLYRGTNQAAVIETPLRIEEWLALGSGAGLQLVDKWKDLHFFNPGWIGQNGWLKAIPRGLAAVTLAALPLGMQYQVYFCFTKPGY